MALATERELSIMVGTMSNQAKLLIQGCPDVDSVSFTWLLECLQSAVGSPRTLILPCWDLLFSPQDYKDFILLIKKLILVTSNTLDIIQKSFS